MNERSAIAAGSVAMINSLMPSQREVDFLKKALLGLVRYLPAEAHLETRDRGDLHVIERLVCLPLRCCCGLLQITEPRERKVTETTGGRQYHLLLSLEKEEGCLWVLVTVVMKLFETPHHFARSSLRFR